MSLGIVDLRQSTFALARAGHTKSIVQTIAGENRIIEGKGMALGAFESVSIDPSCGSQEAGLYLMKTRMQQGLVEDARRARDACLKISRQSCIAAQCRADGGALGAP